MSSYSVPLVTPANTVLLRKSPVTSSGLGSLFHWSLQQTQYCYCAIFPAVDEFVLGSTGHSSKHSTATEITRYVIRAGKLVQLFTPSNTVLLLCALSRRRRVRTGFHWSLQHTQYFSGHH